MKRQFLIVTIFFSSTYSFASECVESPQYCDATIEALSRGGLNDKAKYKYASRVTNSCQYEAFLSLISLGLIDNNYFQAASLVSNSAQTKAIKCLAEAGLGNTYYQYALRIQSQCGGSAMCALARNHIIDENKYLAASNCGR